MGDPDWMRQFDDDWLEFKVTASAVSEFRARFAEWVRTKERNEISRRRNASAYRSSPQTMRPIYLTRRSTFIASSFRA